MLFEMSRTSNVSSYQKSNGDCLFICIKIGIKSKYRILRTQNNLVCASSKNKRTGLSVRLILKQKLVDGKK